MHIQEKMVLRLFAPPVLIMIIGSVGLGFMGTLASKSQSAGALADLITTAISMFSLLPLAIIAWGILWLLWNLYRYWQWHEGKNQNVCPNCGGMITAPREGRYGEYVKCLACGKNTSTY